METLSVLNSEEQTIQSSYDLVRGVFTHEEAAEIVEDLFLKKINFNKQKNFRRFIQMGQESTEIEERIHELKKAYKQAEKQIQKAKEEGKQLSISSTIIINVQ